MERLWSAALSLLICTGAFHDALASGIRSLPVPAGTIYPGKTIDASQLTQRQFQTTANSLIGIATEAGEITGKEARRRLPAGKPIPLSALQTALAVRRGATAVASFEDTGLAISSPVTILEDGAAGDMIDARNPSTGAIIKVVVLPNGGVTVVAE